MNIKGKIVTLRAIEKEDLELMREMLNDPEMENLVVGWAFPVSKYEQEKWYENNITNKNNLRFIIDDINKKEAIGMVALVNLDWKNKKADYGIKLKKIENRNQGIGTDAMIALLRYCFEELNLNKISTIILETNLVSRNFHLKNGWKEEGKLREIVFKSGKYIDGFAMGILKSEYEKLILENHYWDK